MKKKLPFQKFNRAILWKVFALHLPLWILFAFSLTKSARAQAQLLKDINTAEEPYYSEITEFANVGTSTYFVSANELWKTNGTAAGTIRMKAFKSLGKLTGVGTTLYFTADDGRTGTEVWKSNGTAAGTVILRDIRSGSTGSTPDYLTDVNGTLYFMANNGTHGKELWKSNGTAAGTVMVKDIMTGAGGGSPNRITNVNGVVFFQANDNVNGYELWKSNGTAAGTVMVKNIRTGTKVGSFPELLTNVNGKLFFVAADNTTGRELWTSDGTAAGTVRVRDIVPGAGSPMIDNSTNVNGVLYFTANDGVSGKELWKSNGTASGTVLVKDIRPGSAGADGRIPMGQFKVFNGKLYFLASAEQYGNMGIYTTDGTAAGTRQLLPLTSIQGAGYNVQLTYYKNALFFFNGGYTDEGETPIAQLVKMNPDGTGYTAVKRVHVEYYAQTFPAKMIAGSTYLLFSGRLSESGGFELNRSDGTAAGTVAVKDTFVSTAGSTPSQLVTVGNVTYFVAFKSGKHNLYRTNGTPTGTVELLNNFYQIRNLTRAGGRLFFFGIPTWGADEGLYKVENASSPPQLLKGGMINTFQLTAVGNLVYFGQAYYQPSYHDLWRSDGTAAGTLKIASYYSIKNIFDYNGTAMLGILNNAGLELWKSNGTSATTVKIKDVTTPVLRHYELRPYGVAGGIYYFGLENGTNGYEMWRTNATAGGTFMIQDLRTNDTSFPMEYDIADAAVINNSLYFSARDNAGVWALFRTGSNVGSIVKIKDLDGPGRVMLALNNTLMIFTESPDVKSHLWASDGTSDGTTHLKMLGTRIMEIDPAIINDVMYFNVSNNTYEGEGISTPTADEGMWRSDGTACGTFYFNIGAYRPYPMEALGTKLIFRGYTIKTGSEPYAYNTTMAPASPCGATLAAMEMNDASSTDLSSQKMLSFGPNPFTDEMRFRAEGGANDVVQVQVFTLSGEPVESIDNVIANEEHVIGQSWRPGIYVIKVFNGKNYYTERVIKR